VLNSEQILSTWVIFIKPYPFPSKNGHASKGLFDSRLGSVTDTSAQSLLATMPHQLDYDSNTYLAVTLSYSSPFFQAPRALAARHSGLALDYVGQAGGLADVYLYSIPKSELLKRGRPSSRDIEGMFMQDLRASDGVLYVQVQFRGERIRRSIYEL